MSALVSLWFVYGTCCLAHVCMQTRLVLFSIVMSQSGNAMRPCTVASIGLGILYCVRC